MNAENDFDFDYIIVGSGFGGSVSALRLAEKGHRVAVLEQGREIGPADMQAAAGNPLKLFWAPGLGLRGYFTQSVFRHAGIVSGVGVGGGSLIYAAVLLEPKARFYQDAHWSSLGVDWKNELAPFYKTARRMLGVTQNPHSHTMDEYLQKTAGAMKAGSTFGQVEQGIYFGQAGETRTDPFFAGKGPERKGCTLCGECITGCPHNAKNSLDKNYLHLAKALGTAILPEHKVRFLKPLKNGGYEVISENPFSGKGNKTLRARKVILSAGVLGTMKLLFRCREDSRTLPGISPELGSLVRTNSEAIVSILSKDKNIDLTQGTTISTHFYPDEHTHITQNRFPRGYTFMKFYMGPLVDGARPLKRALKTLGKFMIRPFHSTRSLRAGNWFKRISVLTVMQNLDNQLKFNYGRSPHTLFRKGLKTSAQKGKAAPSYLAVANEAARQFAKVSDGTAANIVLESMANMSLTAHILGGCHMGISAADGVIDVNHQVFGHPGLYVVDGAAVSANVGVNPSLTITAMAERALALTGPGSIQE